MKKLITIILTALSILMILDSMQAGQALMMFLLAGVIPGTNIVISGSTALSVFTGLLGFTAARLYIKLAGDEPIEYRDLQNA